jgi:hypothetical protein
MTDTKRVLRAPEAAKYTGLSESTLAKRRLTDSRQRSSILADEQSDTPLMIWTLGWRAAGGKARRKWGGDV